MGSWLCGNDDWWVRGAGLRGWWVGVECGPWVPAFAGMVNGWVPWGEEKPLPASGLCPSTSGAGCTSNLGRSDVQPAPFAQDERGGGDGRGKGCRGRRRLSGIRGQDLLEGERWFLDQCAKLSQLPAMRASFFARVQPLICL